MEAEAGDYDTVEAEAEAEAVDFKNLEVDAEAEAETVDFENLKAELEAIDFEYLEGAVYF